MRGTLVDSNVLIDVLSEHDEWFDWSASMVERAADDGELVINPIIYAEVSPQFDAIEDLDEALPIDYYRRAALPWEAGFLASRAFLAYRRAGGVRRSPLPDFYVGAHAAVEGLTLLTRDARRYRKYFRSLRIIAP
ncbi:MAG TPA: type II toxin-antitoxin system VapC family toxin [Vicinamibacterales bacterium]|nr:type II toxin-antitoxin system VapC family toxin [Vicinamibacterales bacterium]